MKRMSVQQDIIYIENEVSEKAVKNAWQQKKSLYGISKEEFLEILSNQSNSCAGCGDDATGSEYTLHVDHDHYTNEIRGLLCNLCNTALGWLLDDPIRAEKLAGYLRTKGTGLYVPESI
jgi:hypothetical protein